MKILIVDDNPDFCSTIADIVGTFGYDTHVINSPEETLEYLSNFNSKISVILLDIEFGQNTKMNGIDVLSFCRLHYPSIPVVMISGRGTIETAVKATKLGALNFIEKSIISKEKLREVLNSAIEKIGIEGEAREIQNFLKHNDIIGKTKAMLEIGDSIFRFGKTDLNVLISGETGTGKRLVAKAIHAISRRNKYAFVTVDIPNIPRELFQSELFGYNKGSFTGASDTKKGLFHQANKGTLFLDEIGDLSLELQSSLFIPIEEKSVRRIGSTESEELDVRFISATDKDLLYAMKESKFREQLYHRLRECEIHIPPLRERREDIPDMVNYFTQKHNEEFDEEKFFSPSTLEFLQDYDWPGNVRELSSTVKVALQTAASEQIEISDIHKILSTSGIKDKAASTRDSFLSQSGTLKEDLALLDKKKIEATLEKCNGNVSKSAAMLGISRETLHNKIRKYEINTQLFRGKKSNK